MPNPIKKPLVIVTRKLPEAVETRMRELFDARLNVDDKPMSQPSSPRRSRRRMCWFPPSPTGSTAP